LKKEMGRCELLLPLQVITKKRERERKERKEGEKKRERAFI